MAKQQTPQFGLCLDWETSGATFGGDSSKDHQGIQFGAIVFKTEDFSEVETLERKIKFNGDKYKWTEVAEKIHGLTREHLEEFGVTQEEGAIALLELISKYFGDGKVMFMGHNAEFDRRFTNQLLHSVDFEFSTEKEPGPTTQIEVHHVLLDTSPLGFITMGIYKSDLLFEAMGFDARGAHHALDDARMTLATCRAVREIYKTGIDALLGA